MQENYPDQHDQELIEAFSTLEKKQEIQDFLRDLLTLSEIKEASKRLQIAKRLWQGGQSYIEISEELETSTSTVTRVADFLFKKGLNGYQSVLKRLHPKKEENTRVADHDTIIPLSGPQEN